MVFDLFWRIRRPVFLTFQRGGFTVVNLEIIDVVKFAVECLAVLTKIQKHNHV